MTKSWRNGLSTDEVSNLPQFARVQILREHLDLTIADIVELAGNPPSAKSSWKNILAGRVIGRSDAKANRSRLEHDELQQIRLNLAERHKVRLPDDFFDGPLTLEEADARVLKIISRQHPVANRSARTALLSTIPEMTIQLRWSEEGQRIAQDLRGWLQSPQDPSHASFGLLGDGKFGKTTLVSTLMRERPDLTVLWFECAHIKGGYEYLIEEILVKLVRLEGDRLDSSLPNSIGDRIAAIWARLARHPNVVCVFDSTEHLVVDPGYMAERPADPLVFEVIRQLITQPGVRSVVCSKLALMLLGGEVRWRQAYGRLYTAPDLRTENSNDLARLLRSPSEVRPVDLASSEDTVDNIMSLGTPDQRKLFAFITLLGEEAWIGTLRWFCAEALSVPAFAVDELLADFWRFCSAQAAPPFHVHLDTMADSEAQASSGDLALHFKFHDSIMRAGARRLESGEHRHVARQIHRLIAKRAYDIARRKPPEHMLGRNTVARLVRPAQVIKHLLASTGGDLEGGRNPGPLAPASTDKLDAIDLATIFGRDASTSEILRFCHGYFRQYVDKAGDYGLSRVNGADRPKLDLLLRFFALGRSVDIGLPDYLATMPPLPVDAVVDILTAIAIAGLNAGALPEAEWAIDRTMELLGGWRSSNDEPEQCAHFFTLTTRVKVDLLVRAGRLNDAEQACTLALEKGSIFRDSAKARDVHKLGIRHAFVRCLQHGPTEAQDIFEKLGLRVTQGVAIDLNKVDLNGQSGRIAVSVLLRSLDGRSPEADLFTLQQIKRIHDSNWERARSRRNDQVALQIERCMIILISEDAIRARASTKVEESRIDECRQILADAAKSTWNRGVSPITHLDLLMQSARVEYLDGKLQKALELLELVENHASLFGYQIHHCDALLLKAEIRWTQGATKEGREREWHLELAEDHLAHARELERKTGYHEIHHRSFQVVVGNAPTRIRGY